MQSSFCLLKNRAEQALISGTDTLDWLHPLTNPFLIHHLFPLSFWLARIDSVMGYYDLLGLLGSILLPSLTLVWFLTNPFLIASHPLW